MNKRVGIIGASGLVAGVLIQKLQNHPNIDLTCLVSEHYNGQPVEAAHPQLKGVCSLSFTAYDREALRRECDIVFIAGAHGKSFPFVRELFGGDLVIIDLSADFRLRDQALYERLYHTAHTAFELQSESCYGLCEVYREEIAGSRLIANPGCYPTSILLPLIPLAREKMIDTQRPVISNSFSGVSGAGRSYKKNTNHFLDNDNNIIPYKTGSHQHSGELTEQLTVTTPPHVYFLPHIIPVANGILSIIQFTPRITVTADDVYKVWERYYSHSAFIRIYHEKMPQLKNVIYTNFNDIGAHVDERFQTVTIYSCIDNLYKGAATQAIQNMNIVQGWDETLSIT